MTLTDKSLELFDKWRVLNEDEKKKIGNAITVNYKNIDKFFLNQYNMTYFKVVELEKQLMP